MAKKGDTVRYLNATGGGVITRIEGKIAYVEEDGFENPVLISELVVTMPAEMKQQQSAGASLMFNQQAFDAGRVGHNPVSSPTPDDQATPATLPETAHGDVMNLTLAFEPDNIKQLSSTTFSAVLVNDSNYLLLFNFAARAEEDKKWKKIYCGDVNPNELIDLARFTHQELNDFQHIAFQCIALKADREFELKNPISVVRKLDLTKFHKLHCFHPDEDFQSPVLQIQLVKNDSPIHASSLPTAELRNELSKKYNVDNGKDKTKGKKKSSDPSQNPHKLLPLIEIDLHIAELTDSLHGLRPHDMLEMQLDTVRKTMQLHSRRIGQKIVFIHGKGDGVLRKEVMKLLKKEYPKCELQDASFQQYGFGATLVTVH